MNATTETVERTTPYEQLGGEAGVRQLVQAFYDDMEATPEVAALRSSHAPDLGPMRQTLFEFLSGWLGGPRTYFERKNAKCMMSAHASLPITQVEADQWLSCMRRALQKLDVASDTRVFIDNAFTRMCHAMVNR